MKRRQFIQSSIALSSFNSTAYSNTNDKWGLAKGYPSGRDPKWNMDKELRVGNYSGGFESFIPHRIIKANNSNFYDLGVATSPDLTFRSGLFKKTVSKFIDEYPTTGLLIWRDGDLLFEEYRFQRNALHRLTGWSMAKSVSSLLLGVFVDRGWIKSIDDKAKIYVPELDGTLHGESTIRHLMNMSSGAEVNHTKDIVKINIQSISGFNTNILNLIKNWNVKSSDAGFSFNYNELAPMTIGIVMRKISGLSLSELTQNLIWHPIGAESNATWLTDRQGNEANNAFFSATLRDWAKLGILVAQQGFVNSNRIISKDWIGEISTWNNNENYCRFGSPLRVGNNHILNTGYKGLFWHSSSDGNRPEFRGHDGQRILIDVKSKTVIVRMGVDNDNIERWSSELTNMLNSVSKI